MMASNLKEVSFKQWRDRSASLHDSRFEMLLGWKTPKYTPGSPLVQFLTIMAGKYAMFGEIFDVSVEIMCIPLGGFLSYSTQGFFPIFDFRPQSSDHKQVRYR
mmetsp:Transcript_199/g.1435  ORF Transcript_199/g.1435 Transcript_199/m.1435 type:complete len:103 (+) Transcript_199:3036-3344(+)